MKHRATAYPFKATNGQKWLVRDGPYAGVMFNVRPEDMAVWNDRTESQVVFKDDDPDCAASVVA